MRLLLGLIAIIILSTATSCVPTRKITYLQESEGTIQDSLFTVKREQAPYRLQVNDVLSIQLKVPYEDSKIAELFAVNNQPAGQGNQNQSGGLYFTGYTVDVHGNIRVPQLGEIRAIGMTIEELRESIENTLRSEYFREESVLFLTIKLAGLNYTMLGEVNGSGIRTIYRDRVNIIEAIADSGGVPITGDLTAVRLIRQYPDGIKIHYLDLTQATVINSPYFYIQPNDMIAVDPLPQKSIGTGTTGIASFTTILSVFTALVTTVLFITNVNN